MSVKHPIFESNESDNPVLTYPMTAVHPSQPTLANPINEPDILPSAFQSPPSKILEDRKKEIYSSVDLDRNHIHDELDQVIVEKQNNGTADELLDLIIAVESDSLDDAIDAFESLGGKMGRRLDGPAFYGFSGSIASSRISEVSSLGTVEMMELVYEMKRNSDVALDLTNVRSYLWDTLNYTGDWNSSIAVLDTGIDDTHPMLSPWNNLSFTDGKVVGWYDATDDRSDLPEDINSHGSHCAGIAAGYEYNLTDSDNRTKSTWSTKYSLSSSASGYFSYYIEVKNTGWISITTWWNGTKSPAVTSDYVELRFPNGTKADEFIDSRQDRNLSYYVIEGETGVYSVRIHVRYPTVGGTFWATGLKTYPYTPPPANHGMYGGVAPDAKLVSVKIFDNTGYGTNIEMVDGLNWLLAHVKDYHVVAASMSVSFSVTVPSVDSAVAALAYHGVIPVISAGNDGQTSGNQIHSPSHVDECICVGATGDYNHITGYSSKGPGFGNLTKPDLVAPGGVNTQGAILSVDSNDQEADNGFSELQPDDMAIMQGTSMSTPHVAGLVALLAQAMGGAANWDWASATKPFKMKQLLMMTSYEVYSLNRGTKDDVEGYGRVCPDAALDAYLYSLPIGTTYIETLDNGTYGRKAGARYLSLLSGTLYNFSLEVPDNADFGLYLYDGDPTSKGEPILLAKSVNTTLGGLEQIMFTPSSTDTYYIVVKYMTGYGGAFKLTALSRVEDTPSITLVSPANNSIQQSSTLVDLNIVDANGNLKTVDYHWDTDSWATFSSPYDTSIPAGDSGHYLYVNATDSKDNYNYSIFYFTADNTVPSVVLISPLNDTVHNSGTLVDVSVSDTNLNSIYLKWNAGNWGPWSNPYDTNLPSEDGLQTLHVNASDYAGNNNYSIFVFYTDDTYPVVILSSPLNNTIHKSGTLIDVSISDTNLDSVQSKWDGDSWDSWSSPYETNLPTGDGDHILYVNASDEAGNINYTIYVFTADSTTPDVTLESPLNNTVQNSGILVNITVSDVNLDIVYIKWDSGSWIEFDSPYDTTIPSGNVLHTLHVNATDTAGNYNYSIYIFTVDDDNPSVILVSPSNNTVQKGNTLINVSIYDTNLDSVQYKWDSGGWSPWSSPYDTNLPYDDGTHTLYVNATDQAGNFNYTWMIFETDDTIPVVFLNSPGNNTVHNSGISIDVSVTDTNLASVQYKWGTGSWTPFNSPYDTTLPAGDGQHTLHVNAIDDAGNSNYSIFVFTADNTNPVVILNSPTNNTIHNSLRLINVSISDMNLHFVYRKWDTSSWIEWNSPFDTNPPSGEGLHTFHVNATDEAGNKNYTLYVFFTDDLNPTVLLSTPENNTVHNSGTTIDLVISDTNLEAVYYKWDVSSWAELISPYDTSLPSGENEHTLHINTTDLADNYNYTYFVFTTDNTNPSVLLNTPLNQSMHNNGELIDVGISDVNLATTQYKWDLDSWGTWNLPYDTTLLSGDGLHTLYVNATDDAGNYNYSVFVFTTDDTKPVVVLSSPSNESILVSGTLIDISISDNNLDSVEYKWDTDSWTPFSAPYDTNLPGVDGEHILYVNASDLAGNFNYSIFVFTADNTNPSVVLISPTNNTIHNGGTTIDVSISDSHLFDAQYKWDSGGWGLWSSPYDASLPSTDGPHTLFVNATDDAGNFNYTLFIFTTDDTNPSVILVTPANNTVHNSGLTIDLSISDIHLVSVQYKWDSDSWAPLSTPYDTSLPMGADLHTLHINATDSANNENYTLFIFTTDDVAPSILLNAPSNETVHNSGTLIDLAVSDANLTLVQYKWDTDGWNTLNLPYDTNLLPGDGSHMLYVNASDSAGNYNFSIFSFTTDDTNPSVILSSPLNNSIQSSGIAVDCSISDTSLALVQHKWDTGDWSTLISPYDTTLPIGDGPHILYVNAIDAAGNSNNSLFLFTVDDTNPSVTLVNPENNTIHNSGTVVDVLVTDANLDDVEYKWDSGSWTPWSSPYDTVLPMGDGEHILYVNAIDQAGNSNYTLFVFAIDDTKPTVSINYPANNSIHQSGISISLSISDVNLAIVNYKWDAESWSEWTSPYDTVLPMGDRQHSLFVNANDSAGNINYSVYVFVTDDIEPTITLNSPGNNTVQRSSTTVDFSISDLYLDEASFKWDSESWQPLNSPYDTSTPAGDGDHILRVNASDIAGNWNVELFMFTIDDLNPFIILHTPLNNSVRNSLTLVNVSVLDDDLDIVRFKWDDDDWAIWNAPYDTQIPTDDGPHTLRINASDDAENSVNATYLFITDGTLPEITLNSPNNNTVQKSGIVVDLSVSDVNLDNVTYRWDSDTYEDLIAPYDTSVPGGDSAHVLYVNAQDEAGNLRHVRIYITADNILPTIDLLNPLNNSVLFGNSLINLSADDIHLSNVFYWWDSDGPQVIAAPYDTTVPFETGLHSLSINASDTAGNWLSKMYRFTSDNEGPIVLLNSPENNTLYWSGTDVDLSISDLHLSSVMHRWDSSDWTELIAPYDTILPDEDGPHVLEIDASDEAGNHTVMRFVWLVDDSSPKITLVSPSNGTSVIPESLIDFDVTDLNLDTCLFSWNESDTIKCQAPFEIYAPEFQGFWVLKIVANDSLGNTRESIFTFRITDPTPVITLLSPTMGGLYTPGTNVSVLIERAEEVLYNWDETSNTTTSLEMEVMIPDADGMHILYIYARNLTYWKHSTFAFNTDGTAPIIELQSPQNNTVAASGTVIQFSISDNFEIEFVNYSWDGEEFSSLESPYSLAFIEGDGIHILRILAQDSVENQVEVIYAFQTDDTPPTIHLNEPVNGSACLSGLFVNFTVTDTNEFGVAAAWDDGEYAIINIPYSLPVPESDGWHYLSINAIDEAGNSNVTMFAFLADNTAPVVEILSPSSLTVFSQVVTLIWTVTDISSTTSSVYVDDERVITTTETTMSLDLSLGQHEIQVIVIDQVDNTGSASIIITRMRDYEVSILPTNNSIVSGTFRLNVSITLNNPTISINDITVSTDYGAGWVQLELEDESTTFAYVIDTTSMQNGMLSIQIRITIENVNLNYLLEVIVNNEEEPVGMDPFMLVIFGLVVVLPIIILGFIVLKKFKKRTG